MSETNKTIFQFTVNAPADTINQVVQGWLGANGFSFQPKEGANYYYFNDPMVKGKRSLEYYIHGTTVSIVAYLGTFEKPKALEGFVGAIPKQMYKDDLASLFKALEQLNNGAPAQAAPVADVAPQAQPADAQAITETQAAPQAADAQPAPAYNPTPVPSAQQAIQSFTAENEKKKENMVIIGFIMSIVGLLLSCVGFTYGVILIVLEYYFAIQGLKTKKKGLAIATIVLASVSIAVCILSILLYVLFV
ncbi:MAG: hypothetical protein IJ282_05910 [Lachnospiraceae bacterium]|nr:hypothetical protein [Lachnospiraceae bacterium]